MSYVNTDDIKEIGTDAVKEQSKDSRKDWSTDGSESSWDMPIDPPCLKAPNSSAELHGNENPYQYTMHYTRGPSDVFSF